jgi:hypothetical protein
MLGTTRLFGIILIVLGVAGYWLTERVSITALIPAFFGAALLVCAIVAGASEGARKHAMHAAVAIGLIGAIMPLWRALPKAFGGEISKPAVMEQLAMGVLLLIYVALGVQSFIAVRKARVGK